MSKKFGLDFGTTNSAIAISNDGKAQVLLIDPEAEDPRVVRTMLYFHRREFKYNPKISRIKIELQEFEKGDFYWEGDFRIEIGQGAVIHYLKGNQNRTAGITRTIFTGRLLEVKGNRGPGGQVREYYQEVDFGTGRLIQALKTALKSPYYKGTEVFGKFFTLEELIELYIGEIKKRAQEEVGEGIDEVVVGRPVHFVEDRAKDQAAQNRLEEALKLSGFKNVSFEFEPVAAAKQFISQTSQKHNLVFVFDFGGGTLDTAVVRSSDEKVLAADGIYIGGDLLNADIFREKLWSYFGSQTTWGEARLGAPKHIYEALNSWFSIPNLNNPQMMELLERIKYKNSNPEAINKLIYLIKANLGFQIYESIEKAKKELSSQEKSFINFSSGPIDVNQEITRDEFERIILPRVEEIRKVIFTTLDQARVSSSEVDVVVKTGGSSLIPVFERLLSSIFSREKIQQFETFTSIASGLALRD